MIQGKDVPMFLPPEQQAMAWMMYAEVHHPDLLFSFINKLLTKYDSYMQFTPITTARVNFDDEYIVKLKDGSYAMAKLEGIQRKEKVFKCISIDQHEPWETTGVTHVAKLPKGKDAGDPVNDPTTNTEGRV